MSKYALYCMILQCFFCTFAMSHVSDAQNKNLREIRVHLKIEEASLPEVLKSIEASTHFTFAYLLEDLPERQIRLPKGSQSLETILIALAKQGKIAFKRVNQTIYVRRSAPARKYVEEVFPAINVSGIVRDENGDPLPGASILEKGTTNGTISDPEGQFSLNVGDDAILVFSFVGYKSHEVVVGTQTTFEIAMEQDAEQLDEVIVVGYGAVKKSDLTGSVSQVKSEELQQVPVYNVEHALKGRAAGVRVTQNSGAPGGRIEVRIRGGNSMIGSNEPLYVVDGFPLTGGIDYLNPADIKSIDILKDASATAIYGSRGANGVVIITTKKGTEAGTSNIELNTFFGVQNDINRYELLDSREYATVANEWLRNSGQDPYFDVDGIHESTDWQDEIIQKAPIQNHTLTFSGNSGKTRYSVSGNYYDQDGIIINTGVKKGSFRVNLDNDVSDWLTVTTNLNLSRRTQQRVPVDNGNYGGSSILAAAVSAAPTLPVYDENGLPTRVGEEYIWGEATMQNPLIYDKPYKERTFSNSLVGNASLNFKISEKLSFKTMAGLEYENYINESFTPIIYENDRGSAYTGNSYRSSFLNENILTYNTTFGKDHVLTLVGGLSYQNSYSRYSNINVSGFANNTTSNLDLSAAENVSPPGSGDEEWALLSYLARANYTLKDKYLFTFSFRADGSSRFGKNNKWGYFPSGAFAWRVSDESFMKNQQFISDLKLRTSYGITGNTALNPYQSLNRLSSVTYISANQTNVVGYVPSGLANTDLKWEATSQLDIGIDVSFLDNRLRFTADYYKKNTNDLLASVPLPPSMGFGSILRNVGEIQNKGFEFLLDADILTGGDFRWNVTANLSTNRNKIISLADGNDIYGDELNLFRSSLNIAREGEPFGMFYGLVEDGLDDAGLIQYVDQNNDGTINALDRVITGNPYPDFIYGLNTNFSYKNFDLNIFLEGVHGNDIFWATAGTQLNSFQRGNNQFADLIGNYWTEDNPDPNAKYPKISPETLVDVSDRFVRDGSYLRVKSVRLAYNLPTEKMGWDFFRGVQFFVSGTNLFTFTNYPGTDPEANTTGTDSQSVGSRLRIGIDQSAYPSARVFATGFNITF